MAEKVRKEFLDSWRAYEQYAWGHDELRPLTKAPRDWYGESLLITPVDSLPSLILLGFPDEAEKAKKLIVEKLSFDKDVNVKNFEITIRILGGLLSSYEMTGDKRLLDLADDLGKRLLPVFESPTGMPYMFVNLKTGKVSGEKSNPAEIGTLIVEFGTLSRHTKNPIYFAKAKRALGTYDDAKMTAIWRLQKDGRDVLAMPRVAFVRAIMLNHWYHHRGQLLVYLRLLDLSVPSVYGPTADENPFAA